MKIKKQIIVENINPLVEEEGKRDPLADFVDIPKLNVSSDDEETDGNDTKNDLPPDEMGPIEIDPNNDSEQDIAKTLRDLGDNAGQEISQKESEKVAGEIADTADAVNADFCLIDIGDEYWSKSSISYILDEAYEENMADFEEFKLGITKSADVHNVLISGLPGSGKTAGVEAWADKKGLILVAFSATDSKIDAALNGLPAIDRHPQNSTEKSISNTMNNGGEFSPTQLKYIFADEKLAPLSDPKNIGKCIVFVDELNRQADPQLRRPFMSFFNEKRNSDGSRSFSKNILFSIVCINPSLGGDTGAKSLNQAERTRFSHNISNVDSDKKSTLAYLLSDAANKLLRYGVPVPRSFLDVAGDMITTKNGTEPHPNPNMNPEDHMDRIEKILAQVDIAVALLTSGGNNAFDFDNNETADKLGTAEDGNPNILCNSRGFTWVLHESENINDFLNKLFRKPEDYPDLKSSRKLSSSLAYYWRKEIKDNIKSILQGHTFDLAEWKEKVGLQPPTEPDDKKQQPQTPQTQSTDTGDIVTSKKSKQPKQDSTQQNIGDLL